MRKNIDFTSNFYAFFWHFAKKYKFYLFIHTFLFLFLSYTLNMLLPPYILKYFINNITDLSLKKGIFLIFLAAFTSANFLIYSIGARFTFKSMDYIAEDIRKFLFERMLKQSIDYFDTRQSGEIISKVNFIVSNIDRIYMITLMLIRNIILLIISIAIFCSYNFALGVSIFAILLVYQAVNFKMLKVYTEKSNITNEKVNKLTGFINDAFVNISNIKIFANSKKERKNILINVDNIIRAEKVQYRQENLMFLVGFLFSLVMFISPLIVLVYQLVNGQITLGSFLFGAEIIMHLFDVPSTNTEFMQDLGAKLKIFNSNLSVVRDEVKIRDKNNADNLVVNNGKIVFKGVKFSYGK